METQTIAIDLDVYKAIENHRGSFKETHNDILHRILLGNMVAAEAIEKKVC